MQKIPWEEGESFKKLSCEEDTCSCRRRNNPETHKQTCLWRLFVKREVKDQQTRKPSGMKSAMGRKILCFFNRERQTETFPSSQEAFQN